MGNITKAVHYHYCPKCQADWPHPGYGCNHGGPYVCIQCGGADTGSGNSQSAKDAVANMAEKMRDLYGVYHPGGGKGP